MENPNPKMEWTVLGISGFVLLLTVFVSFFKDTDTKPVFYLFVTVSGFVFGAGAFKKMK